jgi:hypothetical protein
VLLRLGVPRHEIRASIPVAPLLSKYGWRFLSPCLRFAPGALVSIEHAGRMRRVLVILMTSLLIAGIGLELFRLPLGELSLCLALVCMLLLWIPHTMFRGSVALPGVATLGDLATCLAKGARGRRGISLANATNEHERGRRPE